MLQILLEVITNFRRSVGKAFFWPYVLNLAVIWLVALAVLVLGAARNPEESSMGIYYAFTALGLFSLPELFILLFLNIVGVFKYLPLRRYFLIASVVTLAWIAGSFYFWMIASW